MNTFLSFAAQPHWDPQTLALAVPVRLRLHQLFAFDAAGHGGQPASANAESAPRRPWRHRDYARVAELPRLFRIR